MTDFDKIIKQQPEQDKKVIKTFSKSKKMPKNNNKSKKERQRKIVIALAIAIAVVFLIFGGVFAYYAKDLPSPSRVNSRNIEESTKIYDRTGETLLYEVHGDVKRTLVPLDEISEYARNATISAEDKNFYRHFGFDPQGVTRAIFRNVKKGDRQGGSTITQQLVKNAVLTPEKTYTRKIKELILSVEIEMIYSKDDILQMYLNEIPYGSSAYGIESAAQTFFSKKAKDLTLSEATALASLPQAPTYYSPFGANTDDLKVRQEWVLDRMVDDDFITQEEADSAKEEKIAFIEKREGIVAPHFVMYVKDQLVEKFGERAVQEGGFKIYTTLDMEMQGFAEEAVSEGVARNTKYNAGNAALTAIDPKNGEILAMQGSKDYWDKENDGNVNVALRYRQPGSSFKPFAYAAAFEEGYTPDTILFDLVTDFGNGYKPENYDKKASGPVTMRTSLANSLNITSVKTLYLAGLNNTLNLAKKMGITTLNGPDRYGLSLVLGGGEVKLLEEVAAFSVFANDGQKNDKKAILKIVDKSGKTIEEEKSDEKRVLDDQIARQINSILSDKNARSGTFGYSPNLSVGDRQVAVKTGTTEEYRDAWTVGYTPSLAAGAWAGNNDNSPMGEGAAGAEAAAPIWHSFMEKALEGTEEEKFPGYEPIKTDKPVLNGKSVVEKTLKIEKTTKKLATDDCPPEDVEEVTFREAHCILYYVEKDDPRGPKPSNPAVDPQYNRWEGPVQAWATKDLKGLDKIPTETTDVCNPDKKPKISITSPSDGELIKEGSVTISADVKAPNGVKSVDFLVDGSSVGSASSAPYSATFIASQFASGTHTITARVTDKVGFRADSSVTITTKVDRVSSVSLNSSASGNLNKSDFPVNVTASADYSGKLEKVQIFLNDAVYQEFSSPSGKSFSTQVTYPGSGSYTMYAAAVDESGRAVFSNQISFSVGAESVSPDKKEKDKKSSFLWDMLKALSHLSGFNNNFS